MRRYLFRAFRFGVAIALGWLLHWATPASPARREEHAPLRLDGYDLVRPVVVCEESRPESAPALAGLRGQLQSIIDEAKAAGDVREASVDFRDLGSGAEFEINPNERFFPASLKKLPLMMQLYREAQSVPAMLTSARRLEPQPDYNAGAAVPPREVPEVGRYYTTEQLIDYMIRYSDNVSFAVLYDLLGQEKYDRMFENARLRQSDVYEESGDFMTAHQFALFFRMLYDATWLNADYSEKAMELLARTDFQQGLVAGVPKGVVVAHKFGVGSVAQPDGTRIGELHDCGVVYHRAHPYLACVMTKSNSRMDDVERLIARISAAAYSAADADSGSPTSKAPSGP